MVQGDSVSEPENKVVDLLAALEESVKAARTERDRLRRERCEHPAETLQPSISTEDGRYCPKCQSVILDDGTVEPVRITGIRTTKR